MHKDFVRWEEPCSITSMSKDRRRKRKSTSSNAGSAAEEESPHQNKPTSPLVVDEDDRKMPAQNEDDAKNDPLSFKRTSEAIDPSGQYQRQTSSPRYNQAFENDKKMPPRSHGNSNPHNAIPGGGSILRSMNEHISWNEGLSSWNQTESFLNTDNLEIQGGEKSFQLNDSIGLNRSSACPQNMENQDSSWLHAQNCVAQQPIDFPPAQTREFNTMFSNNTNMATANTDTNTMLTSINHATTATDNSRAMPTALLPNTSTMCGIKNENVSDFATSNMNFNHHSYAASTNNHHAFEIQQPTNFPQTQSGQIIPMIPGNANISTENFSNNMMPRSHYEMSAINNDIMISYDIEKKDAMHGFGTADFRNINFHTSSINMNVAGASNVNEEDILSPLAIFSTNFDRDVVEGRITFTTAVAARNEDCKEDMKGISMTHATEDLDEDQIDRDLRYYFQQLEKSIWSEEKKQRRL
mmetsp:Transcript_20336/g.42506  ORF Transcript_20336/g.42506 Transcript_20336/m.42506 type:complete len:467 (-) Transcript_20336:19-1419(-)